MEIRRVEDGDVPAVVELLRAADDTRVLSVESLRHQRATRPPEVRTLELVADGGGRIVAFGAAGLDIWTSERGASWCFVTTAADRRGEGIATEIGGRLVEHLRSVAATKATSFIRQTDDGERWAAERGWTRVLSGPLVAVDPRTVAEPEPKDGYSWVLCSELAPEDVYDVVAEATLDEPTPTPHDNLSFDEFVREWNDPDVDLAASAAVRSAEGVVAFSFMKVAGDRGHHGFAGTARAHRGRGLVTMAKRAALCAAARRGVTRVATSNAEENAAMRAVNKKLGFERIGEHVILARGLGS